MVFDSTTGTQMKVKINNFWMSITLLFCWSQRACTVIPVDQLYRFTLSGPHQEPIYSRLPVLLKNYGHAIPGKSPTVLVSAFKIYFPIPVIRRFIKQAN